MLNNHDSDDWSADFRMPRPTVEMIHRLVASDLEPAAGPIRNDTITSFKIVCIGIYALATTAEYRVIARCFGVSKTSVFRCVVKFCKAHKA